jgi:hypothetical protein
MGILDENGERKWKTGLTPEGISASLVTAGTINTGNIAIMNGNNPAFRWDAFGISAFNAEWDANSILGTSDKTKFVRFDKHGIYGINGGVDGTSWKPTGINYDNDPFKEIDANSTFALTWEGLKVLGNVGTDSSKGQAEVRIGKCKFDNADYLMYAKDKDGNLSFSIDNNGNMSIGDVLNAEGAFSWEFNKEEGITMWAGGKIDENKVFSIYEDTSDGNNKLLLNVTAGKIAGWDITSNSIVTKGYGLGIAGSFHIYSSGTTS